LPRSNYYTYITLRNGNTFYIEQHFSLFFKKNRFAKYVDVSLYDGTAKKKNNIFKKTLLTVFICREYFLNIRHDHGYGKKKPYNNKLFSADQHCTYFSITFLNIHVKTLLNDLYTV